MQCRRESRQLVARCEPTPPPAYHPYLSPVCQAIQALDNPTHNLPEAQRDEMVQELLDHFDGHPPRPSSDLEAKLRKELHFSCRLYALKDYRPSAHLYSYMVGGLAYIAKAAGCQGLLILFDEAEFYAILSSAGSRRADASRKWPPDRPLTECGPLVARRNDDAHFRSRESRPALNTNS